MRIAFGSDDENETTRAVRAWLAEHGEVVPVTTSEQWPAIGEAVGAAVIDGSADYGVVMCGTGTGTAIAANKVAGVRAALCADAQTAAGARRWNDANVLALSLRATSEAQLGEILDAWFEAAPSEDDDDAANIAHLADIR